MNSLDRTQLTKSEYRPLLRSTKTDEVEVAPAECNCPEFCELDHNN